jgi:hypothetical protein
VRRRASIIAAIVAKDLRTFSRDKLWLIMAPATLAITIAMFWILPARPAETIPVGLHVRGNASAARGLAALGSTGDAAARGLRIVPFDTEEELRAAIETGATTDEGRRIMFGVALPADFISATWSGKRAKVDVYTDAAVPAEMKGALESGLREAAYALRAVATGTDPIDALPVSLPDVNGVIVGEDRTGKQISFRDRARPLMAIIVLLVEAMALAGLIAIEIQSRTVTAMLVTPAMSGDILAAKALTGTLLGASQALIFLAATKSIGANWHLLLVLVISGAVMMSAVAMVAGSAGRDFMNTILYSALLAIPLMIPAETAVVRGSTPPLIKLLPTYGLIEAMVGSVAYGRGWGELTPYVLMALAWDVVLFAIGLSILKKRVERL